MIGRRRAPPRAESEPAAWTLSQAIFAVFRANRALLDWGDRFAAEHGLTAARWQILGAIATGDGPLSAPQISAAMGITRQGAQKQLDLLVAGGLLEREPNPRHQRSPLYRFTKAGLRLNGQIERRWLHKAQTFAARLPARDLPRIARTLDALVDLLHQDQRGPR